MSGSFDLPEDEDTSLELASYSPNGDRMATPYTNIHSSIVTQRSLTSLVLPERVSTSKRQNADDLASGGLATTRDFNLPSGRLLVRTRGLSIPKPPAKPPSNDIVDSCPELSFTVAVLGCAGVGKSSLISKGFKKYQITKEETRKMATNPAGSTFTYGLRKAQAIFSSESGGSAMADISVLEVRLEDFGSRIHHGWPHYMPPVNFVYLCYDVSNSSSFESLSEVIRDLSQQQITTIATACKCDLDKQIKPADVERLAAKYGVGLVEVDGTKMGKDKMRRLVDWSIRVVKKRHSAFESQSPMSSGPLTYPTLWPMSSVLQEQSAADPNAPSDTTTRTSTSNPHRSNEQGQRVSRSEAPPQDHAVAEANYFSEKPSRDFSERTSSSSQLHAVQNGSESVAVSSEHEQIRPPPLPTPVYQTLENLLHRLFAVAVDDNDPSFTDHFFLTYRRFATPRSVLLGFQLRLRELSKEEVFGNYARLRLCGLLEWWIQFYPGDFSAPGAPSAFAAIHDQILESPHLSNYASDLADFRERCHFGLDKDGSWALKADSQDESSTDASTEDVAIQPHQFVAEANHQDIPEDATLTLCLDYDKLDARNSIRHLRDSTTKLNTHTPDSIAQEITRLQLGLFLQIEPRDWMYHVLVKNKDPKHPQSVLRFSQFYVHLGSWVTSTILCHETVKARAKQMSKFLEVAKELRKHHNYAGLRSITVGVMNATYDGDRLLELFQESTPDLAKSLASYEKLFSSARSYSSYRLALRSVSGPMIPETEIHTSDIARLQDINPDFHVEQPTKIHWGKFNAAGRIINEMSTCQKKCKQMARLNFAERRDIGDCIRTVHIMNLETQHARIPPPELQDILAQSPPAGLRRLANILR